MSEQDVVRLLARARFKARSDTLENWERENPILLSGEPGIVTDGSETDKIKFGDGVTPWNELGWWRGPQGIQGEQGEKGDKGDTGEAAGFGYLYANASLLEEGSEPTVKAVSMGSNTAKTFTFSFGIPKGDKGDQGEQGIQGIQGIQGEKGEKGDAGEVSLEYANNTFAGAIKNAVSGETVSVNDISDIEHTLGVKVSSKNLIPYPYQDTSKTHNGVTYTRNDDGSVTANGTATGTSNFYFTIWSLADKISYLFEDGETYIISGSSDNVSVILHCKDKETNADKYYTASSGAFTVDKSKYNYCHLRLQVNDGKTVDNITVYPMIEKGSTATAYTPYMSDFSTVTLRRGGENILSYPYTHGSHTSNGITWTVNADGSITANGTATAQSYFYLRNNISLQAGTMFVKGLGEAYEKGISLCWNNIGYVYAVDKTLTIPENYNDAIYLFVKSGVTVDNVLIKPLFACYEDTLTEHTPTAEGTVEGEKSISPNMNIFADTEGVIIDCEYNADTKKYIDNKFAELQAAIISTGGNV